MRELLIFASAFSLVFMLGFQSRSVNSGQKSLAMLNSFLIGIANLFVLKMMPSALEWTEIAAYLIGGPLGIVSAMVVHHRVTRRRRE